MHMRIENNLPMRCFCNNELTSLIFFPYSQVVIMQTHLYRHICVFLLSSIRRRKIDYFIDCFTHSFAQEIVLDMEKIKEAETEVHTSRKFQGSNNFKKIKRKTQYFQRYSWQSVAFVCTFENYY